MLFMFLLRSDTAFLWWPTLISAKEKLWKEVTLCFIRSRDIRSMNVSFGRHQLRLEGRSLETPIAFDWVQGCSASNLIRNMLVWMNSLFLSIMVHFLLMLFSINCLLVECKHFGKGRGLLVLHLFLYIIY